MNQAFLRNMKTWVVTEISNHNAVEVEYFIPHHPMFKHDSYTTKIRVVFDASSKTITGISLNNVLLAGPTIQEDLFSIITKILDSSVCIERRH